MNHVSIGWKIIFALIVHDKGTIVYEQLGKNGNQNHDNEDNKGIVSALYGFKTPDLF